VAILGTKVWYADGSITAVRTINEWRALPARGFVVAVQYMDQTTRGGTRYRRIIGNSDWYWMNGRLMINYILSDGRIGEWKDPPQGVNGTLLKRGIWIRDVDYLAMDAQAMSDRSWP